MTDEEIKRIPTDERASIDVSREWQFTADKEVVGERKYEKLMNRLGKTIEERGYHEFTPCCKCCHCIIVREVRNGVLVNTGFGCSNLRINCSPYGTCDYANWTKRGPLVMVRRLNNGEMKTDFSRLSGDTWDLSGRVDESVKVSKEIPRGINS